MLGKEIQVLASLLGTEKSVYQHSCLTRDSSIPLLELQEVATDRQAWFELGEGLCPNRE